MTRNDRESLWILSSLMVFVMSCGRVGYSPDSDFCTGVGDCPETQRCILNVCMNEPETAVSCEGLQGGVHMGTRINADARLELDNAQLTGVFTSALCDASTPTSWLTLDVSPLSPYNKELVAESETGYAEGNLNTSDLLGLWHLNEESIFDLDSIADASGMGHEGSVRSQDLDDKATVGKFNSGSRFDGDNDFLSFGSPAGLSDLTRRSIVAWVKPEDTGSVAYLLTKGDTAAGWTTFVDSANGIGMNLRNVGVYTRRISDPDIVLPSVWQHVAFTWSGTTGAASMRMYHRGAEPGYTESTDGSPMVSDAGLSLRLGAMHNNTRRFAGEMDEVAIFSRVLDPEEVLNIYKRGALRIQYQVRSCDDADCVAEQFVGPDGTAESYYSELMNNTSGRPVFSLTNLPSSRYFQWRAYLETDDADYSPELIQVVATGAMVETESE